MMKDMEATRIESSDRPLWAESAGGADTGGRRDFDNSGVTTPAVNIIETREDLLIEMVAPGMERDSFNVSVNSGVLTIGYEHDDNRTGGRKGSRYRLREYNYHSFIRSFLLPDTVEADRIEARYTAGILHLRIPKKLEAIPRQIEVG